MFKLDRGEPLLVNLRSAHGRARAEEGEGTEGVYWSMWDSISRDESKPVSGVEEGGVEDSNVTELLGDCRSGVYS